LMAVKVKDPLVGEAVVLCAEAGWQPNPNWRAETRPAIRTRAALYLEAKNRHDLFICRLQKLDTPSKQVRANEPLLNAICTADLPNEHLEMRRPLLAVCQVMRELGQKTAT
jgi:hypothetical protein